MNLTLRKKLYELIIGEKDHNKVIQEIKLNPDGSGYIQYNPNGVFVDPLAIGFNGTTTDIGDEELVRAELLVRLITKYKYDANPKILEIERVYKSVGRPGKGGRVDVIVRSKESSKAFLFIECKSPDKFDSEFNLIDGQLFRLSKQENVQPKYLAFYTSDIRGTTISERLILIDNATFSDFDSWTEAGQPSTDVFPVNYGFAQKRTFAKIDFETAEKSPLNKEASPEMFNRMRSDIHDVIWGGGGTNNNDVFVYISKLILCKIFDEKETIPGNEYEFQRFGNSKELEDSITLVSRLNDLYKRAESAYLALENTSDNNAFDPTRIHPNKIAYVVGRLEAISITENIHEGDLLGEFFEQIVAQDFTQSKGQFFTPIKIIRFMFELSKSVDNAKDILSKQRDQLGRPRLPYVIDPSCGSGSFLIEYMKIIRKEIGNEEFKKTQPNRIQELHTSWFSGFAGNTWAKDFLFGIENNYDLGLASKVNMVLHGDGSMNTWIRSGILPFLNYKIDGRHNLLGTIQDNNNHPYSAEINEQFDMVISNPPFSIKMSPEEKREIENAFAGELTLSESLFIERWYQLLREGGCFCCILPEAILDTSTNKNAILFIIKHFSIEAIVSLPYDAFKPFTSTKTCIIYAKKRTSEQLKNITDQMQLTKKNKPNFSDLQVLEEAFKEAGIFDERIFMAEPTKLGYKRRKNLPDLITENELYTEDNKGYVNKTQEKNTVLYQLQSSENMEPSLKLGFITTLGSIIQREGFRLDPKYRWLWEYKKGIVVGNSDRSKALSNFVTIIELNKIKKGDLPEETTLIDLEAVESRQGFLSTELNEIDTIGSDKVSFQGAQLLFSKLEPYLGKVIINPPQNAIGSTEWIGLTCKQFDPTLIGYLLMLPEMCDAYRMLQSGKRHARLDPKEMLELKVEISLTESKLSKIKIKREEIQKTKLRINNLRSEIDSTLVN